MDLHSPTRAKISFIKELHSKASERSCIHAEVDISHLPNLSYVAGDHIALFAELDSDIVEEVG